MSKIRFAALVLLSLVVLPTYGQTRKSESSIDDRPEIPYRFSDVAPFVFGSHQSFGDESQYESVPGSEYVAIPLEQLPRIRSQSSYPLCQTFCPTALLQFHWCKQNRIADCRDLSDSQLVSILSVLTYRDNVDSKMKFSFGSLNSSGNRKSYEVLNSISSASEQSFFSEGCAPFEKISQFFVNDASATEEFRARLSEKFEMIKANYSSEAILTGACPDCAALQAEFNLAYQAKVTVPGVLRALESSRNFEHFSFRALFAQQSKTNVDCKEMNFKRPVSATYFPTSAEPYSSVASVFEQAYAQLRNGNPVILSAICMAKQDGKCLSHCMVLTGKRTIRDRKTREVIDLVRVHNSWGEQWQRANNDGWIRARDLMMQVRTYDDSNANLHFAQRKDAFRFTISWLYYTFAN